MKDSEDLKKNAERATSLLKLLANRNRLVLLCQLVDCEQCVSELLQHVEISQSALSQNLIRMRDEGILSARREGNQIYYRIAEDVVHDILRVLHQYYCED